MVKKSVGVVVVLWFLVEWLSCGLWLSCLLMLANSYVLLLTSNQ
jgi:hypothetical protein